MRDTGSRSMFTSSFVEGRNLSGLRLRAITSVWASLTASSGVDVCNALSGYAGEKRRLLPPSTTAFPSPITMLHTPSSAFSYPNG